MDFKEFIATGFYLGKSKYIPGTVGTLGALPFLLLFHESIFERVLVALFLIVIGIYSSEWVSKKLENKDPDIVVIDEIAGFYITLLFVKITVLNLILGFLIFRILDILKPLGIRKLESLEGGFGIMLDDIAAGILGSILLFIL